MLEKFRRIGAARHPAAKPARPALNQHRQVSHLHRAVVLPLTGGPMNTCGRLPRAFQRRRRTPEAVQSRRDAREPARMAGRFGMPAVLNGLAVDPHLLHVGRGPIRASNAARR